MIPLRQSRPWPHEGEWASPRSYRRYPSMEYLLRTLCADGLRQHFARQSQRSLTTAEATFAHEGLPGPGPEDRRTQFP